MTAYELGKKAYSNEIFHACHDESVLELLGGVGENKNIQILEDWNRGNNDANEARLKEEYPELY